MVQFRQNAWYIKPLQILPRYFFIKDHCCHEKENQRCGYFIYGTCFKNFSNGIELYIVYKVQLWFRTTMQWILCFAGQTKTTMLISHILVQCLLVFCKCIHYCFNLVRKKPIPSDKIWYFWAYKRKKIGYFEVWSFIPQDFNSCVNGWAVWRVPFNLSFCPKFVVWIPLEPWKLLSVHNAWLRFH